MSMMYPKNERADDVMAPEEIAAGCAAARAEWDDDEFEKRSTAKTRHVELHAHKFCWPASSIAVVLALCVAGEARAETITSDWTCRESWQYPEHEYVDLRGSIAVTIAEGCDILNLLAFDGAAITQTGGLLRNLWLLDASTYTLRGGQVNSSAYATTGPVRYLGGRIKGRHFFHRGANRMGDVVLAGSSVAATSDTYFAFGDPARRAGDPVWPGGRFFQLGPEYAKMEVGYPISVNVMAVGVQTGETNNGVGGVWFVSAGGTTTFIDIDPPTGAVIHVAEPPLVDPNGDLAITLADLNEVRNGFGDLYGIDHLNALRNAFGFGEDHPLAGTTVTQLSPRAVPEPPAAALLGALILAVMALMLPAPQSGRR